MGRNERRFGRRNLRIRVFEQLFAFEKSQQTNEPTAVLKQLIELIDSAESSFVRLQQFILKIMQYALIDADQEASKLLDRKEIDTQLAELPFVQLIQENESFQNAVKRYKLKEEFPEGLIKRSYRDMIESEVYQKVLKKELGTKQINYWLTEHFINNDSLANEYFQEKYFRWEEDGENIMQWTPELVKRPKEFVFGTGLDEKGKAFAKKLIESYCANFSYLTDLITPNLKNWDAERVAGIDLILLRLGLVEMLYFPDIPVKVTLNEYIDLAKDFSTSQSGQFVNGVLDKIRKDLEERNEINKLDKSVRPK